MADDAAGFNPKQKEELDTIVTKAFNQGFEQVVVPYVDAVKDELKTEINEVKETQAEQSERLSDLAAGQDRMEKKVDAVTGYHDEEIERVLKHIKLKPLKASE